MIGHSCSRAVWYGIKDWRCTELEMFGEGFRFDGQPLWERGGGASWGGEGENMLE